MIKRAFLFISVFLLLLLASCEKNEIQRPSETASGKTAVLFSSLAEIWLEAGGSVDITVGEAVERGFAPKGTPLVDSGAGKQINTELLLSYKPTLVIASADIPAQEQTAELLRKNGIQVMLLSVESADEYLSALDKMTDITGKKEIYRDTVTSFEKELADILSDKELHAVKGKSYIFIRAGSTSASVKTKSSKEHFAAAMLSEMGLVNISDSAPIPTLSEESIISADPDFIFISLMGDKESAEINIKNILSDIPYSSLSSVKNGKAFILPDELFHFKPCRRWCESYNYLKNIIVGEEK